MHYFIKRHRSEILGSLLCLSLGILSGYAAQAGDSLWYSTLAKPSFAAPSWVFGPVWTMLYIMMGIALGKIWDRRKENKFLLSLFSLQFIFNLSWSPLFFYFHRIDLALFDIALLWTSLLLLVILARSKRQLFLLLLPYILWVSFAMVLNFAFFELNSIENSPQTPRVAMSGN